MKKALCAFLISFVPIVASAEGVEVRAVESSFNIIQAAPRQDASLLDTVKPGTMSFTHKHALRQPMSASVTPSDRVFPQVTTGGGWDTVMVLVNIGLKTVESNINFYNNNGQPMQISSARIRITS